MPISVSFKWNASAITERVALAVVDGLERTGADAHNVWEEVAPISNDPRTRGDLRRMFRAPIMSTEHVVTMRLNAYAPHAIHVEFGTYKDPAQSPLRRTAGMVLPALPNHIKAALAAL